MHRSGVDFSVIGRNSEKQFGEAPDKEDVGVFTADIVVTVRRPEPGNLKPARWVLRP